jgi:CHAT domain
MDQAVLIVRISGSAGKYDVSAEIGGARVPGALGTLPSNDRLEPLQNAILLTTAEMVENRAVAPEPPVNTRKLPPGDAGTATGGAAQFFNGADKKLLQEIGTDLFKAAFQDNDVYLLYRESYKRALATQKELSIKLCVEAAELSELPWEAMFDPRGNFHMSCSRWTPFIRTAELDVVDRPMFEELPLRVLVFVSKPKSLVGTPAELNTDGEQAALDQVMKKLVGEGKVKLCPSADGTWTELKRRINKGDQGKRWDVLLFIGHGERGCLAFEEEGGPGYEWITAEDFKSAVTGPRGPQLVVLNSCRGGSPVPGRFASTAETLVRGGAISAVVAMQFEISDKMGVTFSPIFFENLLDDNLLQTAMTMTRMDLRKRGFAEWISPVLYMQNRDGIVMRASAATE